MDLRSGQPFWLLKNGLVAVYPPLEQDLTCDVVVLGGGITGALVTYVLTKAGVDVIVLDKRDIAAGSTSASTAMLQYEIDKELQELTPLVGQADALRSYQLGIEALAALEEIVGEIGAPDLFQRVASIYATRYKRHLSRLQGEFAARKAAGFQVQYAEQAELKARYGVQAYGAIISAESAVTDAYALAHTLFAHCEKLGARILDRTEATKVAPTTTGVAVSTDRQATIHAKKVVFATGYETQQYLRQKVATRHSTFAVVSEPTPMAAAIKDAYLLWETARPYFYLRATADNRLMMGGGDEPFRDPQKRDRLIAKKSTQLLKLFALFYPDLQPPEIAYAWAGTFGETKDGLAYIGESPEIPNAYFALGYGGNGITYSMIAARIITDLYVGRPNADAHIFRFSR